MSQVAIERVDGKKASTSHVVDEMRTLSDRIREHAFELFERRGGREGSSDCESGKGDAAFNGGQVKTGGGAPVASTSAWKGEIALGRRGRLSETRESQFHQ